jgi:DNA mismatch repair protein MutS2
MTPLSLLDPAPFPRADRPSLEAALVFAFATGDVGDLFERTVDTMPLAPSSWAPEEFARDVFLGDVVARCLPVVAGGASFPASRTLARVLARPPAELEAIHLRHRVLGELVADRGLRDDVEALYRALVHLRALLSRTGEGVRLDALRRRFDVLRSIVEVAELAARLGRASSELSRVGAWAAPFVGSREMARLHELLAYEDGAQSFTLDVRLGYDGKIRHLEVLERRTSSDVHLGGWLARLATKALVFLRGGRFSDDELLSHLVDAAFVGIEEWLVDAFPLVGDLEVYLGALAFRDGAARAGLEVCLPTVVAAGERGERGDRGDGGGRELEGLFNPLLASEAARVVPCDVRTRAGDRGGGSTVIVTGPNSGGKTRLLQSLALAQVLAQAGLFVPARRAVVPLATGLFVSLIEHADADQREGRLGTELLRIRRLFEHLRPGAMVVLDELCSGTNPSEGEDIFRLVVQLMGELGPAAFVTTHFLAFAQRLAAERPELQFLQVELDALERPTYAFVPGVATTSLAHKVAARLGVTEDALRALVRARALPPEGVDGSADGAEPAQRGNGSPSGTNASDAEFRQ